MLETGVWRILDANANRAAEGLRVVEDYARFIIDDAHLSRLCKDLRHELAAIVQTWPSSHLVASRNTLGDVGASVTTPAEGRRANALEVLQANFPRVQQALRCLEEFGKTISPDGGTALERLRYKAYSLEKAIQTTRRSLDDLADSRLYVLVDGAATTDEFSARVKVLIEAGAHMLQLRDKRLDDRTLLARARCLRALTASTSTRFILNDRPDLALLAQADGVHVGQEDLTVQEVRAVVGPGVFIGVSAHSLEQARAAVLDGADYLGVGPTFPSSTKAFSSFTGLELLRAVSQEIRLPAFAIGGITRETIPRVCEAGFSRIAVSGAVHQSDDPSASLSDLLATLATSTKH